MCVVYVDQLVVMSLWRWRETECVIVAVVVVVVVVCMCGICRSAGGDEFVAVERDRVTDNDGGGTGDLSVIPVRHVRYVTSFHFVSHIFTLCHIYSLCHICSLCGPVRAPGL